MDGIALTTWLLVQLAFDSRPSMNEGLRHSQDGIALASLASPRLQKIASFAIVVVTSISPNGLYSRDRNVGAVRETRFHSGKQQKG